MKKLIIGVLLFGFTASANAVFTDNNSYLSDSVSGLDWLDVTATQGLSFNTVSAEFGVNLGSTPFRSRLHADPASIA